MNEQIAKPAALIGKLEDRLGLIIMTYNRGRYLERTLEQLQHSPFAGCRITVLDNCSPDETPQICARYQESLPRLKTVRHKKNIGLTPNYLRAVELSEAPYTWILGDDDLYDFSDSRDLIETLENRDFDLISVGSPGQFDWERGMTTTSKELIRKGCRYFYVFTYASGVIFKTELFDSECITKGYRNAANLYPHFEFIRQSLQKNFSIYVSKTKIIHRDEHDKVHEGLPSGLYWLTAAVNSCATIEDRRMRRAAIYEAAETRGAFLKGLANAVISEKTHHPERVLREFISLALAFSRDQRMLLMLISPLLLIPSPVYVLARDLKRRLRSTPQQKADPFDEFRL